MKSKRILIVEDQSCIASNLQKTLNELGYGKSDIAKTGEEAIEKVNARHPDLILMDIVLEDAMDGITAAKKIHEKFDIPLIYLTGLTSDKLLKRAKITEPYGYILKPFQDRELHTVIEIAFYKHELERKLRESEDKLNSMLESISDLMIMVDGDKNIIWANNKAKAIFGDGILKKNCCDIFPLKGEPHRSGTCLSIEPFKDGNTYSFETEATDKKGRKLNFHCTANIALRDKTGKPLAVLQIARDITEQKKMEKELEKRLGELERLNKLMVGRELRMGELKQENESLKSRIGDMEKQFQKRIEHA